MRVRQDLKQSGAHNIQTDNVRVVLIQVNKVQGNSVYHPNYLTFSPSIPKTQRTEVRKILKGIILYPLVLIVRNSIPKIHTCLPCVSSLLFPSLLKRETSQF